MKIKFNINKERAIYLAAVSQTLGAGQFAYFGVPALNQLTELQGLPGSLEVVLFSALVYIVLTLAGYVVLSDRYTQ